MRTDFTPEEYAIIDSYLHKELRGSELLDFEKALKENPELQAKVKELRLVQLAIGEVELEAELNAIYVEQSIKEHQKEKKGGTISHLKLTAFAASFALIIGIALFFIIQKDASLYKQFYKPDPGLMTVMSYSEHYDFQKAMVDYKAGEYNSSINVWQKQLKEQPENDTLLYFLAAAYQAKGTVDSAQFFLQQVVEIPQSAFYKEANWYLGLIYLQKNQKEKAVHYFKKSNNPKTETLLPLIEK